MQYRRDIDGLRALAVIGVILFHFSIGYVPGGFTGVDVFFVISGFLITQVIMNNLQDGKFTFRTFYLRRFRRLFPAFFATILVSLVASALLFSAEQMTRFGFQSRPRHSRFPTYFSGRSMAILMLRPI